MARGRTLKIFFDGGCRPNPGRVEVAVVARGQVRFFDDLGDGGSSDAEWLALRMALDVAGQLGITGFDLLGDSLSVVQQATGRVPCRDGPSRAHLDDMLAIMEVAKPRRIRWVPRHQNLAGIALDQRRARSGMAELTRSAQQGVDLPPPPL